MKAAVVKNAAMNKDIFLKLIGRDKAIAPQIIENLTTARTSSPPGCAAAGGEGEIGLLTVSRS